MQALMEVLNQTPLLALPCPAHLSVPLDRPVWITANVAVYDEISVRMERYEGYGQFNAAQNRWLDDDRNLIDFEPNGLRILGWAELDDVARRAPHEELNVSANLYHWDDEWRREGGTAGWFALLSICHLPSHVRLLDECHGPFATRREAAAELAAMLVIHC